MKPNPSIRIESGIPIPPRGKWKGLVMSLKPGQSFLVNNEAQQRHILMVGKRAGVTMITRKVSGKGVRCWRKI